MKASEWMDEVWGWSGRGKGRRASRRHISEKNSQFLFLLLFFPLPKELVHRLQRS